MCLTKKITRLWQWPSGDSWCLHNHLCLYIIQQQNAACSCQVVKPCKIRQAHQKVCHKMDRVEKDEAHEHHISMEAIVDAYGGEEQALGWYYCLGDRVQFPVQAKCMRSRNISPLKAGKIVRAIQMSPEDNCMQEMFVEIEWQGRVFGVPLAQLQAINVGSDTQEEIEDWHFWVARGYEF